MFEFVIQEGRKEKEREKEGEREGRGGGERKCRSHHLEWW